MRRAPRRRLERLANDFGDVVIANLARRARTRLVEKTVNPALGEPPPPFAHRVGGCVDAQADVSVFRAFSREQDDTRPLRQPLRCLPARRQALQLPPLNRRQINRNRRLAHRQSSANQSRRESRLFLDQDTS
jgi:hypothetical protein